MSLWYFLLDIPLQQIIFPILFQKWCTRISTLLIEREIKTLCLQPEAKLTIKLRWNFWGICYLPCSIWRMLRAQWRVEEPGSQLLPPATKKSSQEIKCQLHAPYDYPTRITIRHISRIRAEQNWASSCSPLSPGNIQKEFTIRSVATKYINVDY